MTCASICRNGYARKLRMGLAIKSGRASRVDLVRGMIAASFANQVSTGMQRQRSVRPTIKRLLSESLR